jgi:phospholipid-translocating P-type ATPase (flippase)
MSNVERTINTSLGAIMVPYLVFSGVSAGIAAGTTYLTPYLFQSGDGISSSIPILLSYFFTFFILYCFLIPISLYVTIEIVNLLQAYLITSDREMYDPVSDTPAIARSSNLCQELGQIQYVFSDKTGTLTANEMVLRYLSLAGQDLVASLPPAPADAIHAAEDAKELAQLAAAAGGQPAATAAAPTAAAADGGGAPAAASPLRATSVPLENLLRLPAGRPGGVSALPADASSSGLGLLVTGESSETVRARCAAELLAVCHTVLPQRVGARLVYQGESPDEVALVEAAASVGYRLIRREVDDVVIAVGVSAADAPVGTAAGHCPAGCDELRVKVLAVNQFNSTRKRMSCLVKYPDGSLVLYVKGADTNMFPLLDARAHSGDDAARTEAHLRTYAREGLRTLVLAKRTLTSSQAAEWLAKFKAASVSRGDRDAELAAAAEDVERGLSLVALTAIEDRLQRGVPQTLDHLRRAGLKVWVLTGDKVETAVNIGFAAKLLVPEMTLLYLGLKPDGGGPPATTESLRAELRELTTHYAAQILKQLPHLADALNHHGEFELGPGRRKGPSNGLRTVFARVERSSATLTQRLFRTRPASSKAAEVEGGALALIVDGAALTLIMDDDALKEATLHLGRICASVLACRVSPKQKAQVVELVRKGVRPEPLTLSIGDGANDVGMIQAAHVGVGISGKEGMQAVNSSDFAIAQFRFLERLLLLHGRWNYSRMSKVVLYYYYKNFVLSLTLFVYNFQSAFSGTSIYESLMASGYNVILFLPIVFVGALDQDVSARMVQRQPELYVTGRTNMHLNTPKVAATMFNGLITGGVVVAIAAAMQRTNTSGGSLYVLGATVYTWLFFIMQGKLVLEASHWSQALNACWWAHNFVYILFLVVYSYLPSVSPDFEGAGVQALASLNFWLSTVVVVGASLMLDTAFESLRLQYAPTIVDIFKEIDRGYGEGSIDDAVRAQSALGRLRESLGIFRTPRRLAAPARSGAAADADKRSAYDSTHPEMSQSKRAEIHDANVARSASRNVGARPPIRNA